MILLSNSSSILRCSCRVCRRLVRGEHSDKTTARHFFFKPLEILYIVVRKLQGMRVALGFRQGKVYFKISGVKCLCLIDLPRLQEIFEQGDMGQPYSALLLRPVHPTAATERTDGVIRSNKARVRPEKSIRSDRRPRKDAFNERTRANRGGAAGQSM